MINNYILESAKVVNSLRNQATKIKKISSLIFNCSKKNKVLVAGNGGSSADAEHFVGELICTYSKRNRKPISAISLTQPVSAMTAWSNDFDYNSFVQRQVEANGKKGDILFYRYDVWHRGTSVIPGKSRYVMNLLFKKKECYWINCWNPGFTKWMYYGFIEKLITEMSPEQRSVIGIPKPGNRYWNESKIHNLKARYPNININPY